MNAPCAHLRLCKENLNAWCTSLTTETHARLCMELLLSRRHRRKADAEADAHQVLGWDLPRGGSLPGFSAHFRAEEDGPRTLTALPA